MTITIVGALGRLGAYLSDKAIRAGHSVTGIDRDTPAALTEPSLSQSELVVFAVPIRSLEAALADYGRFVRDGATVLDVCTVKMFPCHVLEKAFWGRDVDVVGTHPLFGPQSAPTINASHQVALCEVRGDASAAGLFFAGLGASVEVVTPDEHDRQQCQQFIDHFIGRTAIAAGISRVSLSTKTHERLMDIVDIVGKNSTDLYEDRYSYNPYAPSFLKNFTMEMVRMASRLEWANKPVQANVAVLRDVVPQREAKPKVKREAGPKTKAKARRN